MASLSEIGVAATINILSALAFLVAFALLRIQPFNDRVYFPKWYLKGLRCSPLHSGAFVSRFVNLDFRAYLRFLNWMPAALQMPELELIDHAGLDSVVYLRIYLTGLKIFVPITIIAFSVMVPVNWTNGTLKHSNLTYTDIDLLSISNIPPASPSTDDRHIVSDELSRNSWMHTTAHKSNAACLVLYICMQSWNSSKNRFWTHLVMAYTFTFWTCYVLKKEYESVSSMRLHFLASERRRPDQFTVLVRNVPPDPDESVSELVEHFFKVNHPDHYLIHQVVYNASKLASLVSEKKKMQNWLDYYQLKYSIHQSIKPYTKTGFLGLWGKKVDAIEYYSSEIERLSKEISIERNEIRDNPNDVMPAAFVSFKTRWGAAVCAQTQQSRNPTLWLTEWAPEPRDVYWDNLAIPYVSLSIRRLIIAVAFFFLTFFFMIPIAFVQSLANIEGIEKAAPFLKPIVEIKAIKSIIQGFLPGIALKIFLIFLPAILMMMSKFEGFVSLSALERRSATRYYVFIFINVFLGSIITGTAFQQLNNFMHQSANDIPRTIGVSIPMKATFFITYIMVDGWAGIAAEVLRLKPLIIYHLKNFFFVKTEKDREEAMEPGSICFNTGEPQIQLYFLLGLVYAVITPILLPFMVVFFGLAYVVYRHQIINVYNQEYESAAAFWPDVHGRIVTALVVSQLLLMGLLSTKHAAQSTPLLFTLPILTVSFHLFCKGRYEPAFVRYPLQEAMMKDTLERVREPNLNLKSYLQNAYIHPVFKARDEDENDAISQVEEECVTVPTKRQSRRNTPAPSLSNASTSPFLPNGSEHAL
ncbi:CSC1/OSCA1-like, N-terminal transmembrane domain [Dillenia turbinata]|uniref:CSC1/OSCA1-like, N-terminal transmembrane domain n=1 Tax=Dillenia turbinata TaxID=194707 RepID=A0AAN8UWI5_9MAGN